MKILILHTRYRRRGGEDTAVALQAHLLEERGHEVRLHTEENPSGISSLPTVLGAVWNLSSAKDVEGIVRAWKPDVVHVHNTWFAMSPSVVARSSMLGRPVVATLHNFRLACANSLLLRDGVPCLNCVGASPRDAIRYRCYRGLSGSFLSAASIAFHSRNGTWTEHVDRFLVMSDFARDVFIRHGIPHAQLSVVPQVAIDPGPRKTPPSDSDHVLFVGRLSLEKGLETAIEAWRRLDRRDLELRIIGDGPLRQLIAGCLPPGVRLLGSMNQAEVREAMLGARAALVPSICYEAALPLGAIEAMAAGLPVFGSDHGGIGEAVRAIDPLTAIPPGDPNAWAIKLGSMLTGASVDRLGARSRLVFTERHQPSRLVDALEPIYQWVTS